MNRKLRKSRFLLLAAVLCFALSGCRPSMTFTEIVFDQNTDRILENALLNEIENQKDNPEKDDSLASVAEDPEAATERGRERTDPSPGEGEEVDSVPQAEQEDTLMQNLPGDTPDRTGDAGSDRTVPSGMGNGSGNGGGDSNLEEGSGSSGGETMDGNGTGVAPGGSNGGTGSGDGGSGSEGTGSGVPGSGEGDQGSTPQETEILPEPDVPPEQENVDDHGKQEEEPEESDRIAAAGEAALIIEMLGGGDRLCASSASVTQGLTGKIFEKDWTGEILWEDDGSVPMSNDAFQELLEQNPTLCVAESGKMTFSDTQLEELRGRNIGVLTIPALTGGAQICEAVRLLGEVTGNADRAEAYRRYYEELCGHVRSLTQPFRPDGIDYGTGATGQDAGEGIYALYVSGWDGAVGYSLHNENTVLSGTGMAVTTTGYRKNPVTEMLSLAGVANAAALTENNYSLNAVKTRLLNPIINNLYTLDVKGGSTGATYRREYIMTSAGGNCLGETAFPAVIVPSWETKQYMQSSPLWTAWPYIPSASGNVSGYGFLDSRGNLVESTIHGSYRICVLPSGAGRWDAGSPESILISEWAAWNLRSLESEDAFRSHVADFYREFYAYDLSEPELDEILAGRIANDGSTG